jgi:putative transposase
MPFSQCYYHIVWATKHRQPLIQPAYEAPLFAVITSKTMSLNCTMLAINAVSDHIHIAISMPPSLAIAQWVSQAKGTSSHLLNAQFAPNPRFAWQEGYGVMTFGKRHLEHVIAYIEHQKDHHTNNTLNSWLEYSEE